MANAPRESHTQFDDRDAPRVDGVVG